MPDTRPPRGALMPENNIARASFPEHIHLFDKTTIGRGTSCTTRLPTSWLKCSGTHCTITATPDPSSDLGFSFDIEDSSSNGTFVNNERLGKKLPVRLQDGDTISLANALDENQALVNADVLEYPIFRFHAHPVQGPSPQGVKRQLQGSFNVGAEERQEAEVAAAAPPQQAATKRARGASPSPAASQPSPLPALGVGPPSIAAGGAPCSATAAGAPGPSADFTPFVTPASPLVGGEDPEASALRQASLLNESNQKLRQHVKDLQQEAVRTRALHEEEVTALKRSARQAEERVETAGAAARRAAEDAREAAETAAAELRSDLDVRSAEREDLGRSIRELEARSARDRRDAEAARASLAESAAALKKAQEDADRAGQAIAADFREQLAEAAAARDAQGSELVAVREELAKVREAARRAEASGEQRSTRLERSEAEAASLRASLEEEIRRARALEDDLSRAQHRLRSTEMTESDIMLQLQGEQERNRLLSAQMASVAHAVDKLAADADVLKQRALAVVPVGAGVEFSTPAPAHAAPDTIMVGGGNRGRSEPSWADGDADVQMTQQAADPAAREAGSADVHGGVESTGEGMAAPTLPVDEGAEAAAANGGEEVPADEGGLVKIEPGSPRKASSPAVDGEASAPPDVAGEEAALPDVAGEEAALPDVAGEDATASPPVAGEEAALPDVAGEDATASPPVAGEEAALSDVAGDNATASPPDVAGEEAALPDVEGMEATASPVVKEEVAAPAGIAGEALVEGGMEDRGGAAQKETALPVDTEMKEEIEDPAGSHRQEVADAVTTMEPEPTCHAAGEAAGSSQPMKEFAPSEEMGDSIVAPRVEEDWHARADAAGAPSQDGEPGPTAAMPPQPGSSSKASWGAAAIEDAVPSERIWGSLPQIVDSAAEPVLGDGGGGGIPSESPAQSRPQLSPGGCMDVGMDDASPLVVLSL